MPSRHAHRAALRRVREPDVVLPEALAAFPNVPSGCRWRNPVRGHDYVRSEWQLYRIDVSACRTIAEVHAWRDGTWAAWFAGDRGACAGTRAPHFTGGVDAAFARAAAHAFASCAGIDCHPAER
jgi:hypothetical protein